VRIIRYHVAQQALPRPICRSHYTCHLRISFNTAGYNVALRTYREQTSALRVVLTQNPLF